MDIEAAKVEREELITKIVAFESYISSEDFLAQVPADQADMLSQKYHMVNYLDTLNTRIDRNTVTE